VPWQLQAVDKNAGTKEGYEGHMMMTGPYYLTNPMQICGVELSNSAAVVKDDMPADCDAQTLNLGYAQVRDGADTHYGDYAITVTYTLSAA
jgi:hypothetical protein